MGHRVSTPNDDLSDRMSNGSEAQAHRQLVPATSGPSAVAIQILFALKADNDQPLSVCPLKGDHYHHRAAVLFTLAHMSSSCLCAT